MDEPNKSQRSLLVVLLVKKFYQYYFIVTSHENVFVNADKLGALRGRNWSPVIVKKSYSSHL